MTDVYPLPPPPLRPPSAAGHPRSGPQPSARAAGGPVPRHLQLAALADPRLRAALPEVLAQVATIPLPSPSPPIPSLNAL